MDPQRLDREDPVPLYHQVYRSVARWVALGKYPVGSQLPTEDQLVELLGVSKITVRSGLKLLESQGIVKRVPGRGTFVTRDDVQYEREAISLMGFSEEMSKAGYNPGSVELEKRVADPSDELRARLRIPEQGRMLVLRRLRSVDNVPMAIQTAYLPLDRFPGCETFDFSRVSLYATLTKHYGVTLTTAKQTYRVAYPDRLTAQQLGISTSDPGFWAERLTFDDKHEPVEFVETFYRGDLFSLNLTLVRGQERLIVEPHGGPVYGKRGEHSRARRTARPQPGNS